MKENTKQTKEKAKKQEGRLRKSLRNSQKFSQEVLTTLRRHINTENGEGNATEKEEGNAETQAADEYFFQGLGEHLCQALQGKKEELRGKDWEIKKAAYAETIKAAVTEYYMEKVAAGTEELTGSLLGNESTGGSITWAINNLFIPQHLPGLSKKGAEAIVHGHKKNTGLLDVLKNYSYPGSMNTISTVMREDERGKKQMYNHLNQVRPQSFDVTKSQIIDGMGAAGLILAVDPKLKAIVNAIEAIDPILLTMPEKVAATFNSLKETYPQQIPVDVFVNEMASLAMQQHMGIRIYLNSPLGTAYASEEKTSANAKELSTISEEGFNHLQENIKDEVAFSLLCKKVREFAEDILGPRAIDEEKETPPANGLGEEPEKVKDDEGKGKEKRSSGELGRAPNTQEKEPHRKHKKKKKAQPAEKGADAAGEEKKKKKPKKHKKKTRRERTAESQELKAMEPVTLTLDTSEEQAAKEREGTVEKEQPQETLPSPRQENLPEKHEEKKKKKKHHPKKKQAAKEKKEETGQGEETPPATSPDQEEPEKKKTSLLNRLPLSPRKKEKERKTEDRLEEDETPLLPKKRNRALTSIGNFTNRTFRKGTDAASHASPEVTILAGKQAKTEQPSDVPPLNIKKLVEAENKKKEKEKKKTSYWRMPSPHAERKSPPAGELPLNGDEGEKEAGASPLHGSETHYTPISKQNGASPVSQSPLGEAFKLPMPTNLGPVPQLPKGNKTPEPFKVQNLRPFSHRTADVPQKPLPQLPLPTSSSLPSAYVPPPKPVPEGEKEADSKEQRRFTQHGGGLRPLCQTPASNGTRDGSTAPWAKKVSGDEGVQTTDGETSYQPREWKKRMDGHQEANPKGGWGKDN